MGERHVEIREVSIMPGDLFGEADLLRVGTGIAKQGRGAILSV